MNAAIKLQWWHAHAGFFPKGVEFEQVTDPAKEVCNIARDLWNKQGEVRRTRQADALEVYHGCDWSDDTGSALQQFGFRGADPAGYNVIQSVVDTSVSRLVQSRIRPLILTENGDAKMQSQAQKQQKLVEGDFWEKKIYGTLGEHVCFDGHLFDAGGVKVYPDYEGMQPRFDRIDPCRFLVSPRETRLGEPTQAYYYDSIDRAELLSMFRNADADTIEAIANAKPADSKLHDSNNEDFVDDVEVFEAWHLPSSRVDRDDSKSWGINEDGEFDPKMDPGHDGRRVLCVDGHTLVNEPWPFPYFPVAWFKPQQKRRSYWSRSVPETLAGPQLLLNRMNQRVDAIMYMHARPLIIAYRQAKLNTSKITNGLANILESSVPPNQAIHQIVANSVPSEYLGRIDQTIAWSEKQVGMNDMAMTGTKPAGIDHAPGMEHLSDELSARHTTKFHAWERFHQQLAVLDIDCHRMLYMHAKRNGKNYKVVFGGDKSLEQLDYKEMDLTKAVYRVKVWPTNWLPQTPAARANKLIQYMDAGLISREEALGLLDHPDAEAAFGDVMAKRDNIERKLDMLMRGESFDKCMPTPYIDLKMAKSVCANRLNRLEANGYADDVLDRFRQWFETVSGMLDKELAKQQAAMAPPAPIMPPPPGAALGAGAPPLPPPGPPMGAPPPGALS